MPQNKILSKPKIRAVDPNVLQRQASNPSNSVWVGASAGSGKTKVLTDRILRLLLPSKEGQDGTKPHKILALTFTKAAASEMALRISKSLSDWAVVPIDGEKGLKTQLEKLLGHEPNKEQIKIARQLFASVVDVPGGLKIMTIHSFCQSTLSRFPLEAGLPFNFKALEEAQAQEILKIAIAKTLQKANDEKASPLANALYNITQIQNEDQITQLLQNIISEQRQMQKILTKYFGIDGLYTSLCQYFDIPAGQTPQNILTKLCGSTNEEDLWSLSKTLQESTKKTDQKSGLKIQEWLELSRDERLKNWLDYKLIYLTTKNEIRSRLATNEIQKKHPEIWDILNQEAQHVYIAQKNIDTILIIEQTRDIFILGEHILDNYKKLKEERAGLDFDDLILRTVRLLKGETETMAGLCVAPWVRFKMDQGIDHILVDEAQDTNPEQWEIIQSLCDDFYDGSLNDDQKRTIFIVGDEKQSIFSFQRASPQKFQEMQNWFSNKIENIDQKLDQIQFNISFRSVPAILRLVDSVFLKEPIRQGLGDAPNNHHSYRTTQAGLVELWPIFEDSDKEAYDPWAPPIEIINSKSGATKMANYIGEKIQGWIENKQPLESYNRPIQPGDIMILVRSRTAFLDQLVRALKIRNIPVSGVDRMILRDQLVIQDLCAFASFALLPDDDLTLATILKSPLIGWSENQLFDISYKRQSSLWDNLKKTEGDSELTKWLTELIQSVGKKTPYEFFTFILQNPCPANQLNGIKAIKSRLGEECLDPLNEFLNSALKYEQENTPSLQNFVQSQLYDETQIKRQMEKSHDAVRIMTVHGAKGLQAPIVILPDTTRTANSYKSSRLLWPDRTSFEFPFFCATSENLPEQCLQAKERLKELDTQEYRRLLYVALTRAESQLYIGGYKGSKPVIDESWYHYVRQGFDSLDNVKEIPLDDKNIIYRYANPATDQPDRAEKENLSSRDKFKAPKWLFKPIPDEPFPPRPLMPSRPTEEDTQALSPLKSLDNDRFKRGNITHKLLQILPDVSIEERQISAERYVAQPAHALSKDVQSSIVKEVMDILTHPEFAEIFGENSIAEAPITGLLNGNTLVSGQIDRLLITANEIIIIDYKSNRPPPKDEKDIPAIYMKQMQTYADLLRFIYPNHRIKAALIWTDGCQLMPLKSI